MWMDGGYKRQQPEKEAELSFFSNKMVGSESALMSPVRQELISSETKTKAQSVCKSCQILPSHAGWASTVVKNDTTAIIRSIRWCVMESDGQVWVRKRSWLITRLLCIQMYEGEKGENGDKRMRRVKLSGFPQQWCDNAQFLYLANEQPFFFFAHTNTSASYKIIIILSVFIGTPTPYNIKNAF